MVERKGTKLPPLRAETFGAVEETPGDGQPTLEDLEAMFAELAQGHESRPVLVDKATQRSALYADHDWAEL